MCKDYAKHRHNLSVERIADDMGMTASRLYQHLENGDMPFNRVRSFQRACRCNYVTQYMAYGDNCMLVPIPSAQKIDDDKLVHISATYSRALNLLTTFHQNGQDPDVVIEALTAHMETTAWHRANVEKHQQPEFDFERDE